MLLDKFRFFVPDIAIQNGIKISILITPERKNHTFQLLEASLEVLTEILETVSCTRLSQGSGWIATRSWRYKQARLSLLLLSFTFFAFLLSLFLLCVLWWVACN